MAINPNASLKAEHVAIVAGTGGGKTAAAKLLDRYGDQVAILDVYCGYKYDGRKTGKFNGLGGRRVYHYYDRKSFAKAFINAWRSGLKFVVAYTPIIDNQLPDKEQREARQAELYWFGRLMWEASDGNRKLTVIIEELAKMSATIGRDDSIIGELASGGRQFGLQLITIFQRSQEVPKTIWNNSPNKILGAQESMKDAEAAAKELDVDVSNIVAISKLSNQYENKRLYYMLKSRGLGNVKSVYVDLKTFEIVDIDIKTAS